jgi:isopenicillin N synthase-like dioxygenase
MAARRVRAVAAHVVAPRREPPQEISVSGAASTASGGGPQTTAAVPVVDVSPFLSHQRQPDGNYSDSSGSSDDTAAAAAAVVAAVGTACRDVGFMVVTGHGIDPSLTQRCADEASGFFSQPEPTKLQVAAKGGAFGYIPLNSEALGDDGDAALRPDLREAFAMGPVGNLRPQLDPASLSAHDREVLDFCYQPTPWPGQPQAADSDGAGLRTAMEQLYLATATLGDGLLRIFGQALGIDEALLLSKTTHHFSAMAAINYPALRQQLQGQALRPGQLRCGPHQDSGTLTIVWENAEGLEVLPRGSTTWQPVRARPLPTELVSDCWQ